MALLRFLGNCNPSLAQIALEVAVEVEVEREGDAVVELDAGHGGVVVIESFELQGQQLRELLELEALQRIDFLFALAAFPLIPFL